MIYIYPEKNLRAYPGTVLGTKEWNKTYKIKTAVERASQVSQLPKILFSISTLLFQ